MIPFLFSVFGGLIGYGLYESVLAAGIGATIGFLTFLVIVMVLHAVVLSLGRDF